jgi:hypothetical protein
MDLTNIDIDRIVREIVARLRAEMEAQPVDELSLDTRVVTMTEVKGKLDGIRQLKIGLRAIVTPSVRDELNDKKITLVRAPI